MQDGMSYKERQMYLCKTQKAGLEPENPLTDSIACDMLILLGRSGDGPFLMIGGGFCEDRGQRLPAGQKLQI